MGCFSGAVFFFFILTVSGDLGECRNGIGLFDCASVCAGYSRASLRLLSVDESDCIDYYESWRKIEFLR